MGMALIAVQKDSIYNFFQTVAKCILDTTSDGKMPVVCALFVLCKVELVIEFITG